MKTFRSAVPKHSQKKKIFWLSFLNFDFSNVISQTEVSKQLSKRGNDVYLFAMGSKENCPQINANMHLTLIPLKFVPIITASLYVLALLIFLPFHLIIKKPDYIITEKGTSIIGFILKIFLRPLNFKVILDIRSTPLTNETRERANKFLFRVSISLAKKLDGITILTEHMKKEFCHKFNINPSFVGVWTSGVSTTLFDPEKYDGKEMREKLGLTEKFIIFYHGGLRPHGLVETIKAIEMLKEKYHDLTLFMLGSGPYLAARTLTDLVREIGLQNNVIIHEKVNYVDVPKYIAMCDLGIVPLPNLPNWRYQCPLKLLEYLAMKKVVIATDIPANREVMGKSKSGIYVPSTDPKEIAKAIIYAHENKENLKEWGCHGRAIIEEKFTWEKVAEDFDNHLSKLSHVSQPMHA
jgi:glycosyltransferase involved in cell wall biosynthesis